MCGGRDVKENVCDESKVVKKMTSCSWGEKGEVCEADKKSGKM